METDRELRPSRAATASIVSILPVARSSSQRRDTAIAESSRDRVSEDIGSWIRPLTCGRDDVPPHAGRRLGPWDDNRFPPIWFCNVRDKPDFDSVSSEINSPHDIGDEADLMRRRD